MVNFIIYFVIYFVAINIKLLEDKKLILCCNKKLKTCKVDTEKDKKTNSFSVYGLFGAYIYMLIHDIYYHVNSSRIKFSISIYNTKILELFNWHYINIATEKLVFKTISFFILIKSCLFI